MFDFRLGRGRDGPKRFLDSSKVFSKRLTKTPFDEKIEWTYYELWHHQERRARMGTAMMGPDYNQWHGFYEVAKTFYTELIPEAEALMPGVTSDVMNNPYQRWTKGLSKETAPAATRLL